jgi:hypothetical protein
MTRAMASLTTSLAALAARDPASPVVNFQSGDVHIASPDILIENRMPDQSAPVVNVAAAEVRVDNHVPQQPAPVVHVAPSTATIEVRNEVQAPSISEVTIVGMPSRETSTSVKRDKDGNIVTTTQTERDA